MDSENIQTKIEMMKASLDPWIQALTNPAKAQEIVLERLLKGYGQTEYGREHKCENVGSYTDFKKAFPVHAYVDFKPLIDKVMAGNIHALLSEEPIAVSHTKGTTGEPKIFPFTPTSAKIFLEVYSRVALGLSLSKNDLGWMSGYRLNLVPSANVKTIKVGERELNYGYALAVILNTIDRTDKPILKVTPTPDELATLPKESTKLNWETRYEFMYEKAREKNITHLMTQPEIALGFGRYLDRKHHIHPKDLWQIKYIVLTGHPGIHTRYPPPIHDLYGKSVSILDIYAATEGGFGVQLDDKKAWSPVYDLLFFEIQTINGIKQLHEMVPGEIGSLIVSTPDLPRYRLYDLILAFEPPYFRCIGRENTQLHPFKFSKLTGKSDYNFPKSNLTIYK